jgi:hypothetical protein
MHSCSSTNLLTSHVPPPSPLLHVHADMSMWSSHNNHRCSCNTVYMCASMFMQTSVHYTYTHTCIYRTHTHACTHKYLLERISRAPEEGCPYFVCVHMRAKNMCGQRTWGWKYGYHKSHETTTPTPFEFHQKKRGWRQRIKAHQQWCPTRFPHLFEKKGGCLGSKQIEMKVIDRILSRDIEGS